MKSQVFGIVLGGVVGLALAAGCSGTSTSDLDALGNGKQLRAGAGGRELLRAPAA